MTLIKSLITDTNIFLFFLSIILFSFFPCIFGSLFLNHQRNIGQIFRNDIMSNSEYDYYLSFIKELNGTLLVDFVNKLFKNYCGFNTLSKI